MRLVLPTFRSHDAAWGPHAQEKKGLEEESTSSGKKGNREIVTGLCIVLQKLLSNSNRDLMCAT